MKLKWTWILIYSHLKGFMYSFFFGLWLDNNLKFYFSLFCSIEFCSPAKSNDIIYMLCDVMHHVIQKCVLYEMIEVWKHINERNKIKSRRELQWIDDICMISVENKKKKSEKRITTSKANGCVANQRQHVLCRVLFMT